MVFPKKIALEYDLSCVIEKGDFSRKYNLTPRRKMKDDISQKIQGNMIFTSNAQKKWSFQKEPLVHDLPCTIWKGGIFSQKHDIFSADGKWDKIFLKKYMERWYFLCTCAGVTNVTRCSPCQKNQRWSYPAKIHLKVIDILDRQPRKSFSDSLFSCTTLQRKKSRKLNT